MRRRRGENVTQARAGLEEKGIWRVVSSLMLIPVSFSPLTTNCGGSMPGRRSVAERGAAHAFLF
jgi:hypothetical protein